MRVPEYRLNTRLTRAQVRTLGAALTAAGFAIACDTNVVPMYGIACETPNCNSPVGQAGGGQAGAAGHPGGASSAGSGGRSDGGEGGEGGAPP
jgi:hypothetical protein